MKTVNKICVSALSIALVACGGIDPYDYEEQAEQQTMNVLRFLAPKEAKFEVDITSMDILKTKERNGDQVALIEVEMELTTIMYGQEETKNRKGKMVIIEREDGTSNIYDGSSKW